MTETFNSPTYGILSLLEVKKRILSFITQSPEAFYRIIIGTDSQVKNGGVDFVTALVIHRVGSGGIYFWQRKIVKKKYILRDRIYEEAGLSLSLADKFLKEMKGNGISTYDVEIHVDIGQKGETREMINEVVGMIRGSGYQVAIKPDSYGASKVADRHT